MSGLQSHSEKSTAHFAGPVNGVLPSPVHDFVPIYISFTQSCECNVMYINNPVTRKSRYTV